MQKNGRMWPEYQVTDRNSNWYLINKYMLHDHKLRIFIRLKFKFNYLEFHLTFCFNYRNCSNEQYENSNILLKILFTIKISVKIMTVWNFEFRTFSVYGHGARYLQYWPVTVWRSWHSTARLSVPPKFPVRTGTLCHT